MKNKFRWCKQTIPRAAYLMSKSQKNKITDVEITRFWKPAGVLNDMRNSNLRVTVKLFFAYYLWWVAIFAATARASDPWPNRIPEKLALCYVNKTLSDRFRRMPNSMDNLVSLIRKVEAHPDTALWTIGKMASTLIHRYGVVHLTYPFNISALKFRISSIHLSQNLKCW